MKHSLLVATACAVIALSGAPAAAEGSCGVDSCPPPSPSPPPSAPVIGATRSGSFFVAPEGNVLQGQTYYPNGIPTVYIFLHGPGGTVLTDAPYSLGDDTSHITFSADIANARATAISHQGDYYGRNDVSAGLGYSLALTASNSTVADAVAAILAHGPLASVSGAYGITTTGTAKGIVSAYSQFEGPGTGYNFGSSCGYYFSTGPCTTGSWSMNLGFKRGTEFSGGDPNSFYASFFMGATAESGNGGCFPYSCPGDATAFIDPTISYNTQLGQYGSNLTFNAPGGLGDGGFSFVGGGAVPEPASWALMLGGFGMLGGAVRRRRVTFATA